MNNYRVQDACANCRYFLANAPSRPQADLPVSWYPVCRKAPLECVDSTRIVYKPLLEDCGICDLYEKEEA